VNCFVRAYSCAASKAAKIFSGLLQQFGAGANSAGYEAGALVIVIDGTVSLG
jgi:hypothetical protein